MKAICLFCIFVIVSAKRLSPKDFAAYKAKHPHEFSGQFEGDIVRDENGSFRNAQKYVRKWKDGVVHYDISGMGKFAQSKIRSALKILQTRIGDDCIKFVEKNESYVGDSFIIVFDGDGCYSAIGRTTRPQQMSLSQDGGCLTIGTIQHEFIHAIGFLHEQNRSDRDEYLNIHWQNIEEGRESQFNRIDTNNLETPYNYRSIMHYGNYAFSKNGDVTMEPKQRGQLIGSRRLHILDVTRIRKLYHCKEEVEAKCEDMANSVKCWGWWMIGYCEHADEILFMKENCNKYCGFC